MCACVRACVCVCLCVRVFVWGCVGVSLCVNEMEWRRVRIMLLEQFLCLMNRTFIEPKPESKAKSPD